ncbi:MAG: hypothetical protein ACI8TX_000332 [Hyphomicrobiaceae bacterium]
MARIGTKLLAILPIIIWVALSWRHRDHAVDDGLIYLRFAANALAGHGLVYNPGELVNGLTSPLFGSLVLAGGFIVGDVAYAAWLISCAATAACAVMVAALFGVARPQAPVAHRFVAALFVTSSAYAYYAYGMEGMLFSALVGLSVFFYVTDRPTPLALALAATVMARPEGVFLVAIIAADVISTKGVCRHCAWSRFQPPCSGHSLSATCSTMARRFLPPGLPRLAKALPGFGGIKTSCCRPSPTPIAFSGDRFLSVAALLTWWQSAYGPAAGRPCVYGHSDCVLCCSEHSLHDLVLCALLLLCLAIRGRRLERSYDAVAGKSVARIAAAQRVCRGDVYEWLTRDQPDFVVIHDPPWHLEAAVPAAESRGEYRNVANF